MKNLIYFSLFVFCTNLNAQLSQVVTEVFYDPSVDVPVIGYPANHITYRVYAELQNPNDFVSAIFADEGCHSISISAEDQIYNNSFGATLGEAVNNAFCNFVPSLCYDSFITIGRSSSADPGNAVGVVASCPNNSAWSSSLGVQNAGPDLFVCGGEVYALSGDSNGYPSGPLNRVLLFQLTLPITVTLNFNINLQVFPNDNPQDAIRYVWDAANVGCANPNEVDGSGLGLIGGALFGCDDPDADNYNPDLPPGGTCYYLGCTDANALNYNPEANLDNELCVFDNISNGDCQNPIVIINEDEPVVFANFGGQQGGTPASCWTDQNINGGAWANFQTTEGEFVIIIDNSEVSVDIAVYNLCDGTEIACTEGLLNDSYFHVAGVLEGMTYIILFESNDPGAFSVSIIDGHPGCNDIHASNYDAEAVIDDDSCEYIGCMDPQACNYSPYFQVDDGSCEYASIVNGIVYADVNGNGYYNDFFFYEDYLLPNQQILINETGEILFTDQNGAFETTIPEGETYTLSLLNTDDILDPFPNAENVSLTANNQCTEYNLELGMTTDSGIEFFALCPSEWWQVMHCYNGLISGLHLYNVGTVPFDGSITMTFDPVLLVEPTLNGVAPTAFDAGIAIWEFEDQLPGQYLYYNCHFLGTGVDYAGEQFQLSFNLILFDENDNEVYNVDFNGVFTVGCSYDPNDKQANPVGYAAPHFILPDQEIEYKIRFQNTGNAAAEYVIITDSLDINTLDISTFAPVYGSHNFSTSLLPNGLVEFTFNNINLPDSASDPLGSEGFVVYRIKPRLDITPGTEINNTAYIYFEQNPPIITNTTWHTIYDCNELVLLDGSETAICPDGNASFEITYPYVESLEWSINGEDAGNGNIIEFTEPESGDYTIELIAANPLCSATSNASIHIWESPVVSISENQALITATAGYDNYQWYFEGSIIDGANQQTYVAEESGNYSVAITDANGCTAMSDDLFVLVIGIDEINTGFIALYPNPMTGFATLQFDNENAMRTVRILDSQGREIRAAAPARAKQFQIQKEDLPSGQYFLELNSSGNIHILKLLVY